MNPSIALPGALPGAAPDPATLAPTRQRGSFNDVALGALLADCRVHYPNRVVGDATASGAAILADVDREART